VLANSEYNVVRPRLKPANLVNNNIPKKVALELLAVPNDNSTYFVWTGVGDERTMVGQVLHELQTVFTTAKNSRWPSSPVPGHVRSRVAEGWG
jgi:hypothetical protein